MGMNLFEDYKNGRIGDTDVNSDGLTVKEYLKKWVRPDQNELLERYRHKPFRCEACDEMKAWDEEWQYSSGEIIYSMCDSCKKDMEK